MGQLDIRMGRTEVLDWEEGKVYEQRGHDRCLCQRLLMLGHSFVHRPKTGEPTKTNRKMKNELGRVGPVDEEFRQERKAPPFSCVETAGLPTDGKVVSTQ